MYVCVCNAVTERRIEEAVREGASTMRDLRQQLGVAGECGRCGPCARECLRSALAEQAQATKPATLGFAPAFSCATEAL